MPPVNVTELVNRMDISRNETVALGAERDQAEAQRKAAIQELDAAVAANTASAAEIAALKAEVKRLTDLLNQPTPPPTTATYVHREDFAQNPRDRNQANGEDYYICQCPTTDGLTVAGNVLTVKIRSDQEPDAAGRTRRCEIRRKKAGSNAFLQEPLRVVRWYALSVKVPSDWLFSDTTKDDKFIWFQSHNTTNSGGPPLEIHLRGQRMKFLKRTSTTMPTASLAPTEFFIDPVATDQKLGLWLGKWRRAIFRVVWDHRPIADGGLGALDVWLDGAKVFSEKAPQGVNDPLGGPYVSGGGIYSPGWAVDVNPPPGQVRVLQFRDVRFGDATNKLEDFI